MKINEMIERGLYLSKDSLHILDQDSNEYRDEEGKAATLEAGCDEDITRINHMGYCPVCGSSELEYGAGYPEDEMFVYPYTCLDCKNVGKEWYALEPIETESTPYTQVER